MPVSHFRALKSASFCVFSRYCGICSHSGWGSCKFMEEIGESCRWVSSMRHQRISFRTSIYRSWRSFCRVRDTWDIFPMKLDHAGFFCTITNHVIAFFRSDEKHVRTISIHDSLSSNLKRTVYLTILLLRFNVFSILWKYSLDVRANGFS